MNNENNTNKTIPPRAPRPSQNPVRNGSAAKPQSAMAVKAQLNAAQIKQILEDDKFNSSIYIMLDTLYYLKKGGRITPAAAAIGTMLKLKPVLQIQGEKLDSFAKARTYS